MFTYRSWVVLFFVLLCSCVSEDKKQETTTPEQQTSVAPTGVEVKTAVADTTPPGFPPGNYHNTALVIQQFRRSRQIDSLRLIDSVFLENEEFMENMTDGGGSVTGYFSQGKLVKIAQWIGFSYGVRENVFYFADDKLIYVTEVERGFVTDSSGTDHSRFTDTEFYGYYFFDGNKMFDEVSTGHNRFENEENNAEKEYLSAATSLKKTILRHKRTK